MEKHTTYSFCGIATFIFLLYFAKVSGKSIIDVMKHDAELDKLPKIFNESTIIKTCSNVKYPEGNETSDMFPNPFLCLVFYDTYYKISRLSQFITFNDSAATFDAYLKTFFPNKMDSEKFCKNLTGINVSYKKLEPLLSQLVHFDEPYRCVPTCFNTNGDFNQLCAIIAWRKSIDNNIKMTSTLQKTTLHDNLSKEKLNNGLKSKNPSGVLKSDLGTAKTINSDSKKANVDVLNNGNQKMINSQSKSGNSITKPPESMAASSPLSASNAKSTFSITQSNIGDNEDQKTKNKDVSPVSDLELKVLPNSQTAHTSEKLDEVFGQNFDISNNKADGSAKDINDDIKTSTISENTQDHDNSVTQAWNHGEDEKLSNDPNNQVIGLDRPNETGNQNQNMPKSSEQRDISPFHSMRSDEESHVFTYFTVVSLISIAAYVGYHNKQKILAIVLEGRRSRNSRGRRRPSTANYRKLNCTLEEAVTSQCNANVTHVIY